MRHLLKRARKNLNLTMRELSEKSGVAIGTICNIEKGKCSPTLEVLGKLWKALNINILAQCWHTGDTISVV